MQKGDIVRHSERGEGRVLAVEDRGVTVVFWRNGICLRPAAELTVILTEPKARAA